MASDDDLIRFYFSFRSPYAWFALHRLGYCLKGLPVRVEYIPVYPPDDMQNDPVRVPNKVAYMGRDVRRIAAAYGLPLRPPASLDTDWAAAHGAFLWADDRGQGEAFAREVFAARWQRGEDVGDREVLAAAAAACGLDPDAARKAADDPEQQARARAARDQGFERDGLFGVPFFVFRDETYWGNDRLDWLLRAVQQANGRDVPDLTLDPMTPPQSL